MSDQRRECHAQGAAGIPPAADMALPAPSRRVRADTVTATTPVPGDLEPLDRPAPQRTRGREAEPARRRGQRDCGNSVDTSEAVCGH